jgi:rhamnose utilization protein RhaD (predicted bifunctional aldolase and dehydrogenase)/NAD(P)-dependent dehydrogenase (short-subunit alcohol dehydrogenase family)
LNGRVAPGHSCTWTAQQGYAEIAMESRWNDREAQQCIARYAEDGVASDLALRVYTTRLLGGDPRLVLHGGGNTSVKTRMRDLSGDETEVLCVKGSGWDMASIEPAGLPAVRLEPLRRQRTRESLSDEDMVRFQRANLIDPMAPNPSVETLLHAFLPHAFVDHTHSTAILALVDQPNARELCAEVYGRRAALVPYVMPGFGLAQEAAKVFDHNPDVEALILDKHGIFTFGASAREAYERMIEMATLAEARLSRGGGRRAFSAAALPPDLASLAAVAPIVRGACSLPDPRRDGAFTRPILEFRSSEAILNFVNGTDLSRYGQAGVVTPDHTIRTKAWPLILPPASANALDGFRADSHAAARAYIARYDAYFERHNARHGGSKRKLDPLPRIVLVPGLGLFGLGGSRQDAIIVADLAESAIDAITEAEALGTFTSISESDLFDIEYWSLEQAKLKSGVEKPLAGQVAAVTGAAGAIGAATARAFAEAGAAVALLDLDAQAATRAAKAIGGSALAIQCDVTDAASVRTAFDTLAESFGGLDVLVSNAGAAWQGRIGEVDESVLRASFELNFYGHQRAAQSAVRIMRAQGTGGCLLFNVSKQAVNPGPDFGPYGLPKAATLFLVRQYALEYGGEGIRANAVNADRIRSGLLTDDFVAARAKARGVSEADYMRGNLLRREVAAEDVAQAFLHHALALKTTGDVTTVDGGNIAAALR